jgi:hypothetical protein
MMHMNFRVIDRGGARAGVLMTLLVVGLPAHALPQLGVIYDKLVDESHN